MYIICFSLNLLFKFTSALPGIMVMISFIMNRDVLNASIVTGFDKNLHQAFNTWSLNGILQIQWNRSLILHDHVELGTKKFDLC